MNQSMSQLDWTRSFETASLSKALSALMQELCQYVAHLPFFWREPSCEERMPLNASNLNSSELNNFTITNILQ
jgi:hypothetical protein